MASVKIANRPLRIIVEQFGLRCTGQTAVELLHGCPVTLKAVGRGSVQISLPAAEDLYQSEEEEFVRHVKKSVGRMPRCQKGELSLQLNRAKSAAEDYQAVRAAVLTYLAPRMNHAPCAYCGLGGCDRAVLKDGKYVRAHARCHAEQQDARHRRMFAQGSYVSGFFGGLLASLLLAALAILLAALSHRVFGYLFALLPWAAVLGYQKLHGRYGAVGMAAAALGSVVSMIVYLYGVMFWMLWDGLGLTLWDCLANLLPISVDVFSPWNLRERWFELLFYLIGLALLLASRPISQKRLAAQEARADTLSQPLAGVGGDCSPAGPEGDVQPESDTAF